MIRAAVFKLVISLVAVVALVWSVVLPVSAQTSLPTASPMPSSLEEDSGFQRISSPNGPHFFSGDTIIIDRDLNGDVFVAGGSVMVTSRIDGDLLVGAGQVNITGEVTGDARIGAGSLELNGLVGDDLTVGAGAVVLSRGSQVMGSAVIGAGDVSMYGTISENVWVGASTTTLGGNVGGDVNLHGERVTFLPEIVVVGDLTTRMTTQPLLPEGASVSGQQQFQLHQDQDPAQTEKTVATGVVMGVSVTWFIVGVLMSLLAGSIVLLLLPGMTRQLSQTVLDTPWAALGWGVVHLVLTPIAALLLMMTVIGLPLGLVVLLLWLISLIVGGWISALALGQKVLGGEPSLKRNVVQLMLGLLILGLVGLIPIIGSLVTFLALVIGLGALVIWIKGQGQPSHHLQPEVAKVRENKAASQSTTVRRPKPSRSSTKNSRKVTQRSRS